MELSSGYILSALENLLKSDLTFKEVVHKQCNFQVETNLFDSRDIEIDNENSLIAVLHNIIVRGFPTFSSYFLEKRIEELSEFLQSDDNKDKITVGAKLSGIEGKSLIEGLSFSNGPTSYTRKHQKTSADSQFEASLVSLIEDEFGEWISNILCQQVPFSEIDPNALDLKEQRVDYLLPFPVKIFDLQGFVIEMDGPQHQTYGETDLDTRRENLALKNGYGTIRIRSSESDAVKRNKIRQLKKYLNSEIFHFYKEKENSPYKYEVENLLLNPLASARIQLVVVKAVLHNQKWLKDSVIRIAIIERDVSNLALAVEDLNHWFSHFSIVTGANNLPIFECECFSKPQEIEDFDQFHTIVDISLKSRFSDIERIEYPNGIIIRNSPLFINSVRKIVTGPHVEYHQFGVYENSKWELKKPDNVQSLTYFLRSLFRKKDFKVGQLPILNRSLDSQSVIGLLPTGGGKSLTYQLSALLQPGVCMVIDPIISLMRDQVTGLRNHWIDACDFLNSSIKTREERERVQKRISEGASIFFFVSPERLLIKGFREKLQDMSLNHPAIYFSYCVIDEAHCVSEWGHDFRTSYLSVAENAMRFCIAKNGDTIPLFALTATASYDVLTDIQRELSGNELEFRLGEESIIELEDYTRPELNFEIVSITADDLRNERDFNLKRKIAEKKNAVLYDLITDHKDDLNNNAGLIFCPHRGHFFGVTDRFKHNNNENVGVLDVLERQLPNMHPRMGFFMGSGDDDELVQEQSIQNQDQFIDGKLKLLVATKAFGMGIDKNNIRFTVHYNYPGSIESFLQEAGRAGRDGDQANCYLLYTPPNQLKEDVENDVNQYFHSMAYRGAEKEKEIISELLYKVFEPDRTYQLTADIQDEFNPALSCVIWKSRTNNRYVSVQESFNEKLGSIMVRNDWPIYLSDEVNDGSSKYSAEFSDKVLNYVKNKIISNGNADQVWDWLNSSGGTREGILDVMKSSRCTREKYSGTLELAWENNIRERIKYIQLFVKGSLRNSGYNFQDSYVENVVSKAIDRSLNFSDVIEKIEKGLNKYNYSLEEQTYQRDNRENRAKGTTLNNMERYYNQVRDKADTEKAIYRLRLLGVIDDYTVDYRTQMFTLYLSKKDDLYYKKRLSNYLSKFYADERVNKEMARAVTAEGKNQIQKYLNYLVDFGYEQIANKRKRSIEDMKRACEYGIEESIKSDQLAEFLNLYLNSKYSRDSYLVDDKNESLPHNLENGKVTDSNFIWHYIDLVERDTNAEINNLKHLRGAALRLQLEWIGDNPILNILAAYSTFILEFSTPSLLTEAENNLMAGLDFYENQEEWSEEMLRELFDELIKKIRLKRPEIDNYYQFKFENFRLSAIHKSLLNINSSLSDINSKVNSYG